MPDESKRRLSDEVSRLLLRVAEGWRLPVVLVNTQVVDNRVVSVNFTPETRQVNRCVKLPCRGFPACLRRLVKAQSTTWTARSRLYAVPCSAGKSRCVVALPLQLPGYVRCYLTCGCLPLGFTSLGKVRDAARLKASSHLRLPISDPYPAEQKREFGARLFLLRNDLEAIIRTQWECKPLISSAANLHQTLGRILTGSASLLDNPYSDTAFVEVLDAQENVRAIAHLDVICDRQGRGRLRHRQLAVCQDGKVRSVSRRDELKIPDFPLEGVLRKRWNLALPGYRCDSDSIDELGRANDVLARYVKAFRRLTGPCPYVMIGRLGRDIARGTCDLDAQCEYRKDCHLFAKEEKVDGKPERPWRKRMVAVDLVLAKNALHEDKVRLVLLQMASMLGDLRDENEVLQSAVLRGLPRLRSKEQRHYLRYLFEQCRAIPNPPQKGAAFERFVHGLLSLVPGWIPGSRNLRTRENELDLTVLVEPGVREARYWFQIFGPKIIVECKNYPGGLPQKIGRGSPVRKLRRILQRSQVRLGLLINTGEIHESLWQQSLTESRPDELVVLLDGAQLSELIDNPHDIDVSLKQWVSDAAIRARTPRAPKGGSRA